MNVNHKWSIVRLDRAEQIDDKQNVVTVAHYAITSTDDDANVANDMGACRFQLKNDKPFIPYESLSESDVLAWVKDQMGGQVAEIEARLEAILEKKRQPPTVFDLPVPWLKA